MKIPPLLKPIAQTFRQAGYSCYLVGGAVRDMIQGKPPVDYDLATDALPEHVMKIFRRVVPTGIRHGTVTILHGDEKFEVTTFRTESGYSDSRHPDEVRFTPSIFEDLKRRDFTINSMALDLITGDFIDPHGGKDDLKAGVIKAIGNPVERFTEDALRSLRACRFASQLHFTIVEATLDGIRATIAGIRNLSVERIRDELIKILSTERPSIGLLYMDKTGVLSIILPELEASRGVLQKGLHRYDVFMHSILSCDGAPSDNLPVRLAALFHDIGKPQARSYDESGQPTFYNHERISESMAGMILRRLRFPTAVENKVCRLIANHMFNYEPGWTDAAVRRFIAKAGPADLPDLFLLREADHYGMEGERVPMHGLWELEKRVRTVLEKDEAFSLKNLAVNGDDLSAAGIPKGRIMGLTLSFLLETVLDDPEMNDKGKLLGIARSWYDKNFLQNH